MREQAADLGVHVGDLALVGVVAPVPVERRRWQVLGVRIVEVHPEEESPARLGARRANRARGRRFRPRRAPRDGRERDESTSSRRRRRRTPAPGRSDARAPRSRRTRRCEARVVQELGQGDGVVGRGSARRCSGRRDRVGSSAGEEGGVRGQSGGRRRVDVLEDGAAARREPPGCGVAPGAAAVGRRVVGAGGVEGQQKKRALGSAGEPLGRRPAPLVELSVSAGRDEHAAESDDGQGGTAPARPSTSRDTGEQLFTGAARVARRQKQRSPGLATGALKESVEPATRSGSRPRRGTCAESGSRSALVGSPKFVALGPVHALDGSGE